MFQTLLHDSYLKMNAKKSSVFQSILLIITSSLAHRGVYLCTSLPVKNAHAKTFYNDTTKMDTLNIYKIE